MCASVIMKTTDAQIIEHECFGKILRCIHMTNEQPNNPLHGISLEKIVTKLFEHFGLGWIGKENQS